MSKKKILLIVGVVSTTIVLLLQLVLVLSLPTIMHNLTTHKTDLPEPEVTYCEFPFEITYKLNGETKTISDIYVCEYVGSYWNWNIGNYREWKGYLKSNQNENIVLIKDGNLHLCLSIGSPEYYMGDSEYYSDESYTPHIFYVIEPNEAGGQTSGTDPNMIEKLTAKYNLKIISWELSEPTKNTFN